LRLFDWDNYLLACPICNSNYKGEKFPLDKNGNPLLINPVEEEPLHHIKLSPFNGRYGAITVKGHHSIKVYGLNRQILVKGRVDAWRTVKALIILYGNYRDSGKKEGANELKETICNFPFISEFIAFLDILESPAYNTLIDLDCIKVLKKYPEIKNWIKQ
jgi:hypothetical protein